jgi:glycine hydroxymethyltransferase
MDDKQVEKLIIAEEDRQQAVIPLIASENYCSADVQEALGSVFVNKYAEGRPGKRFYAGNQIADELELLTEQRALDLFDLKPQDWAVNVQPLSGTPANLAVLTSLLKPKQRLLSMDLDAGGHLSHGHTASLIGQLFDVKHYSVDKKTGLLDYDKIAKQTARLKPKVLIAGASAYPREIDFKRLAAIAHDNNALLLADISHIAGLVAAGEHISPFPEADVVTTTTHKTLRGPRAALIFCRQDLAVTVNRGVFPGLQGGPHLNQIAATAVALHEAMQPSFKIYAAAIRQNAAALAKSLTANGWKLVTGGTENHLLLIDLTGTELTGATAQQRLEAVGIISNANRIPFDQGTAFNPSGLRLGTAAVTTLGAGPKWCQRLGILINDVLRETKDQAELTALVKHLRFDLLTADH